MATRRPLPVREPASTNDASSPAIRAVASKNEDVQIDKEV